MMIRIMLLVTVALLARVADLRADVKDLPGAWVATEATSSGEKLKADFFEGAELVLGDGRYSATLGGATDKGRYTIDTSKSPNTIDLKASEGQGKGKTMQGIFELSGDTLKIAFNLETMKRPTDFTSTAQNKHFVVVYKRKK